MLGCTKRYEEQDQQSPTTYIQEEIGEEFWVAIQPHFVSFMTLQYFELLE
jgi:hypothetical protein